MKTCASCGKANNPIRKYCVRCGKPLISAKDEKPTSTPTSVITPTQIPDIQPSAASPKARYVPSDNVAATTDDEWVRPSQVSKDRVRSGSASGIKSEMEKAREAFARAEGVGIEEADGSGVVETRMLRASEVRELMGDDAVLSQEPTPPAQPIVKSSPPPAAAPPTMQPPPRQATPPAQAPPSVAPTPTHQPVTPSQPVTQSPPAAATVPTSTPASTPMNKTTPPVTKSSPTVAAPPPKTPPATPVKQPAQRPIATSASSISLDTRIPEIEEVLAQITEPEDMNDSKIKDLITSLTHQHAELRQVNADLTSVSARLDEFVRNCQNDAEVRRIHYESLNEQTRIAKHDYEEAKKEYERVDKRRKKEIENLENKVRSIEKGISKTEDDVTKRVNELDKVREKIAQLQDQ